MSENTQIVFKEVQHFVSRSILLSLFWIILVANTIVAVFFITSGVIPDYSTLAVLLLTPFIPLIIIPLKLVTEIDENSIKIKIFHFVEKQYLLREIEKFYIRDYNPILEYGGWGIRCGKNGKAYNVSGNTGLQLELKNDKKVLIGTRQSEEILAALKLVALSKQDLS